MFKRRIADYCGVAYVAAVEEWEMAEIAAFEILEWVALHRRRTGAASGSRTGMASGSRLEGGNDQVAITEIVQNFQIHILLV